MARERLNQEILRKIAEKSGSETQRVRERVSRLASKLGIRSEAALLVEARRHRIGIARALGQLDPVAQAQVRDAVQAGKPGARKESREPTQQTRRGTNAVAAAVDVLLTDEELRSRCRDLLLRGRHLDRAVREAATVVEDRLRQRSGLGKDEERTRRGLIGRVLNPEPNKAIIVVSQEPDEQRGVFELCAGLVAGFGNKAHHTLSEVDLGEALAMCGLANVLLRLVEKGQVHKEGVER
jgi:uncharacterized protein (TIGR02391 family)